MQRPMRIRRDWLCAMAVLGAVYPADAIVIDNGLAPPNPANIVSTDASDDLIVRDGGCAGEPIPCPSPGPPTTVELQASLTSAAVFDSSLLIATGGFTLDAFARNDAQLEIDGGTFYSIWAFEQASILLSSGGTAGIGGSLSLDHSSALMMSGGGVEGLMLMGMSSANITGGATENGLQIGENAQALISGGQIGTAFGSVVTAHDQALLTLTGGLFFTQLFAEEDAVIRLVGSGFAVDGESVGYGPLSATSGTLTGTLLNGGSVDSFFDQGGGGTIVLIPEPSTATLLVGGLLALSRIGRRAGRRRCPAVATSRR